ncbi:MAG: DUF1858 domain-containing protein, partial [Nanoarchaeota archaeon]|nr:DUF1858 domain-containing protein [Nanoarchaeota archaeon]
MQKITKDMIIKDILDKHPEAAEVFMKYGLRCVGCPSAAHETLENGLKIHGMDHEIE